MANYVQSVYTSNMSNNWNGRKVTRNKAKVLNTYGDVCHLCNKPGADTADHLIPRSLGGDNSIDNQRPAHRSCNSRRGNRPLIKPISPAVNALSFFE